jgi:2-C-methyl-D-erythritol 4-phosphate cytidylyltransferase
MKVHALIPAAGAGRRMGGDTSKQYLALAGRPILAHTLTLFQNHPSIDNIVLIAPAEEIPFCRDDIVTPFHFDKVSQIVAGGEERQDSVRNGLQACGAAADDIVLIHDGVRPLLPSELIDAAIATAADTGASLVAVPAKDTIKIVDQGKVVQTPDRSTLWQAQTPQAFRCQIIASAHEKAYKEGYRATDDAQLAEWIGQPVTVVPGSYCNLKITTPEDLLLAESFLDQNRDKQ